MENASKALLMAGSVLLALMIIGALLLMFSNLTAYQETNTQDTREAQVIEFNRQYETYNRNNVRGSDLYSLLNRVIDYNRRKSTAGTGGDEGQYIAYEEMRIEFKIQKEKLTQDGEKNQLFEEDRYEVKENKNEFESNIIDSVTDIENEYGKQNLNQLSSALTKIFINSTDENKQKQAIATFNSLSKKQVTSWEELQGYVKKQIYEYSELVQFKRAMFDCKEVKYNEKTGRIIYMRFEANGTFQ